MKGDAPRPLMTRGLRGRAVRPLRRDGRRGIEPRREIRQGARGDALPAGSRPVLALEPLASRIVAGLVDSGKQTEVDVHGLERPWTRVDRLDMSAGNVPEEGSKGRRCRRRLRTQPAPFGNGKSSGQEANGGAFDVAFDASDLAGETQSRLGAKPQQPVKEPGTVQERVAMQAAEAGKLRAFQPGDGAKDAGLLAMSELGLEADHVPQGAKCVVLAKLDDRSEEHTSELQ